MTKGQFSFYSLAFISAIALSCGKSQETDFEKAKKELLYLDSEQRRFHFTKNASGLVALFSKNFMSVNKGEIEFSNKYKSLAHFKSYFDSVDTFLKWDNIESPVIRFSDDGSIAYVVVHKIVILKRRNSLRLDTTNFAWLTVYKKNHGKWQIDCVTSTNK